MRAALVVILFLVACTEGPADPTPVVMADVAAPMVVASEPRPIERPLEARLGAMAYVTLISHSDEPLYVHLRWSWGGGRYTYEEGYTVPPRATVTRYPECFFGGTYRVTLAGYGIALRRDYGSAPACCHSPGMTGCHL